MSLHPISTTTTNNNNTFLCFSPVITTFKDSSVLIPKTRNINLVWDTLGLRCNALSKNTIKGYKEFLQDEFSVIKRPNEILEDVIEGLALKVPTESGIKENVERIRGMLKSMNDGEISISPYDTAWVALVKDEVKGGPHFPSSLEWIANNQLPDGSWGDNLIFSAHDRVINTLACLIALKSWGVSPEKQEKGISFLKENIVKLGDEKAEHMPIGFEVAFPALIDIARSHGLEIEISQNSPALQEIYAKRQLKLKRIPKEIMHTIPTTLLHSLEGMAGLDWGKLLNLQSQDGSFLFSPSSTAYALMQTKDFNCFTYLNKVVHRFNGGVPNVYPVDLFEHMWAVDRLQRLGISRYFESELKDCLEYVYSYWTEQGICWARNSEVQDIDDTAMGFRLLRLHGYEVSADVFKNFEKDGEFFCFALQSTQAVTGMYNLLRASQLQYNGEKILEEARNFSSKYLKEKQASNQLFDKWIITKDLPGEVGYALDIPWYASLPRLETRFYIEQYGGENDVWIGKTLYRMPFVSNNVYLELAKSDYNNCQSLHRLEWDGFLRWYLEHKLEEFGVDRRSLLVAYFLASATIFEPEKSRERIAWAKTSALVEAIALNFGKEKAATHEERKAFVSEFHSSYTNQGYLENQGSAKRLSNKQDQRLVGSLVSTLNQLSLDALMTHGRDTRIQLFQAWEKWLRAWEEEGDRHNGEAELCVQIIQLCSGRYVVSDYHHMFSHPHFLRLAHVTNRLCQRLGHLPSHTPKVEDGKVKGTIKRDIEGTEIELDMQKLIELVLSNSLNGVNPSVKQTFLAVVKTFYYTAICSPQEIDYHIAKVLFQKID